MCGCTPGALNCGIRPDCPDCKGTGKRRRGFATMDRAKVAEIARKGGKAAHAAGTAHQFSSEEARRAGRLGGKAVHAKKRAEG